MEEGEKVKISNHVADCALHLHPPAALQAHMGDSLGGKETGALGRKFSGKEKGRQGGGENQQGENSQLT